MNMDDATCALAEMGYHLTLRSRAERAIAAAMGAVEDGFVTALARQLEAGFKVVPEGTEGAVEWAQKTIRKGDDGSECELAITLWLHRT